MLLINGKYRNYANIRINALGRSWSGAVKAISYKSANAIDPVKVVGTKKTAGYTQGDETHEGSVTLFTEFLDTLQKALPAGLSIMDVAPFPISVSYVDELGMQVSHTLKGCKFKENGRSGESGSNDALSQEIPLFIFDINWNA